ncbi:hypothetical protein ACSQ67_023609 [Phaseolus vulgaris]
MNGSKGGVGFYFRAGREVKAIRLPSRGVYSTHSPVFRTRSSKCATPYEDLLPFAHSPFTRFSKQKRKGGQQVPRALCPTHLSEASVVHRFHRMLLSLGKDRIDPFPFFSVHSLYISDTQGRTRWEAALAFVRRSFRRHLAFTPPFDCRSGMEL